jgi:hypothetical protein
MEHKIWYEMVDIKYGEIYLTKYLGFQRTLKKIFNILTLILSVSGILGWKNFENYAWIAFILIAIMQLFTLIENEIIRSDKEIDDIASLRMMYTKYFNKIEKLWTKYEKGKISEEDSYNDFFILKETDWVSIEELDCKLNIKRYKWLEKKADSETRIYINKFHNYGKEN